MGAEVHGVGGQDEWGALGDAVPHHHHVLVSLPAEAMPLSAKGVEGGWGGSGGWEDSGGGYV